jgi:hypothetical protein
LTSRAIINKKHFKVMQKIEKSPEQGNKTIIVNLEDKLNQELTKLQKRFEIVSKRKKFIEIRQNLQVVEDELNSTEFESETIKFIIEKDYNQKITIKNSTVILKVIESIKNELNSKIENLEKEILSI